MSFPRALGPLGVAIAFATGIVLAPALDRLGVDPWLRWTLAAALATYGRRHPAVVVAAVFYSSALVDAGENEYKLARAVANYLIAARAVIADNQDLINDSFKGDKRFTPERYAELVRKEFLESTSIDIGKLKSSTTDIFSSSLYALHQSAMEVTASFQPRITSKDPGFKGVHPAVFGARIGQELYKHSDIKLKQTSSRYRATYNKPDDFELMVLGKFEARPQAEPYYEETTLDGKRVARYLAPLYITKACLKCHGDPAGELDITGRAKEGYKDGVLRGAISVIVPVR